MLRRMLLKGAAAAITGSPVVLATASSSAERRYGPGVTDTEIKIGQTIPYSGPASALSILGRVESAYVAKVNADGGVNGRKIKLISLDDGFSPPKAVEQVRRLVEQDNVLAIMGMNGTPTNLAVAKYLNNRQVPQVLGASSSPKLSDPVSLPWTTTFYVPQTVEGKIYARYLLETKPHAKIGVLYQNDDFGKGYLAALRAGLGQSAGAMIIKEASYELSDPTVDSQIVSLEESNADTLFLATTPKFASEAIRKAYDIEWRPLEIVISPASQINPTLKAAGLDRAVGLITSVSLKHPGDPMWASDRGMLEYYTFMRQWAAGEPPDEVGAAYGYSVAQVIVEVLRRCGDELTRENVLKQATDIRDLQLPLFIPGVRINVSPNDRVPWKAARIARFDGTRWAFISGVVEVK